MKTGRPRPRWDMVMYFAEDLRPPGPDADFDFGFPRWMLRETSLMTVRDRARIRAAMLGPVLARLAVLADSPWAALRAVLESRGLIDLHCRDGGPPLASCLDHVTAAPRTGPPAGRGGLSFSGGVLTSH